MNVLANDGTVIMGLTGAWAYSLFGFISAALMPVPFVLFKWGAKLRARSKYNHEMMGMAGKQSMGHVDPEMGHMSSRS